MQCYVNLQKENIISLTRIPWRQFIWDSSTKILISFLKKQKELTGKCSVVYDFVPYKYGCFSFLANQDISSMQHSGEIALTSNNTISLKGSKHYTQMLDMFGQQAIQAVKHEFGNMEQNDLLKYIYTHQINICIPEFKSDK